MEMGLDTDQKRLRRPRQFFLQRGMLMACFVFGISTLLEILFYRCLYADGSHEFIGVLEAQNFVSLMWSRHFAFYIYEFPLVLAIKSGVTNMGLLRLAFGLGCYLPWPAVLACCYWMSPKHFWLATVGCAAGFLNAAFMAVGEHILAHAFFWSSLFAILFARPLKPSAAVILLISATGFLFSYESQLFLCLPLAALSLWRIAEERMVKPRENKFFQWSVLLAAAGLFLAASGIGLYAVLKPEIPVNFGGFRANAESLLWHKGWTLTWTIIWACLMLGAWLSENFWKIITSRPAIIIQIIALAIWGMWPLLRPDQLDTAREYDNRILDLLVPLLLLPVALILRYRPAWIASKEKYLAQMAAILLAVQSLWQICASWQWHKDVGRLQTLLSANAGPIPLRSTVLARSSMESWRADFDWSWPCLSIALNPSKNIKSMVCSEFYINPRYHFWQPFDPLDAKTLPDLQHYGIDFAEYKSAIISHEQ